ncbi:MAG TPA: hypothetical protein VMA13_00380 [Candidatus Saccharimonadales bacterium]|nr:hypothetical protein [Candidatus Saccharimonadales bacterium]
MKKFFLLTFAFCCVSLFAQTAFLDQKKNIESSQEWNREITRKSEGDMRFKILSEGSISVTFMTDALHTALVKKDMNAVKSLKKGVLFSTDSSGTTFERTMHLESGDYWFIIRNNLKKDAEVRLECFEITNQPSKIFNTETNSQG